MRRHCGTQDIAVLLFPHTFVQMRKRSFFLRDPSPLLHLAPLGCEQRAYNLSPPWDRVGHSALQDFKGLLENKMLESCWIYLGLKKYFPLLFMPSLLRFTCCWPTSARYMLNCPLATCKLTPKHLHPVHQNSFHLRLYSSSSVYALCFVNNKYSYFISLLEKFSLKM